MTLKQHGIKNFALRKFYGGREKDGEIGFLALYKVPIKQNVLIKLVSSIRCVRV